MSSSGGTPISYKPRVNRAITKRWAEAKQISYEGNDWGDEDDDYYQPTPSSARGGQQPSWPAQTASTQRYGALAPSQGTAQSNRNFNNPSPPRGDGRQSFDRGDDRRNFSSQTPSSGFEGRFPTAQHAPFPEPRHDFQPPHQEPSTRAFHGQPPLHVQTQVRPQSGDRQPQARPSSKDHAQYNRLPSALDAQDRPHQDPVGGVTYGSGDAGRRSESSGRPSLSELQGRSESPYRTVNPPLSGRSQPSRDESPAKRFPPRKSSLSQDTPIMEPNLPSSSNSAVSASDNASAAKPLPFIRPADIYKRMEEEREKERRSQESSRPSIDSNASRPRERDAFTSTLQSQEASRPKIDDASGITRDNRSPARTALSSSVSSEQLPSENKSLEASEDTGSSRKPKSTLDPVAERKSEYGFENMLEGTGPDHPPSSEPATSAPAGDPAGLLASSASAEQAEPITAASEASKYPDRPDPVAASSQNSEKSLPQFLPVFRGVSVFGPDFLDQNPAPSDNLSPVRQPANEAQDIQVNNTTPSGAPSSSTKASQDTRSPSAATSDPVGTEMRHSPSTGPGLVAHQGIDNSQDQVPPRPLPTGDSALGPNGASASGISPINTRTASSDPPTTAVNQSKNQHAPIAEETVAASTPPVQSAAAQPRTFQEAEQSISEPALPPPPPPPPPPAKDDHRQDYSIPSPENSQARPPATVGIIGVQERQLASKPNTTPTDSRRPWEITRMASEDSPDQRKAFETKVGPKDSSPSTPASTSGAPAGPSTKGTVRELAEKLESRSGRASPAVSVDRDTEPPRPAPVKLESFRPSLPGGWRSYTTNTDTPSPRQEHSAALRSMEEPRRPTPTQPDRVEDSPVSSEDDDIPTAGPPRPRGEGSDYGPSKAAFTAAAAAGSALVGAFTSTIGLDSEHGEHPHSYEVSDDEPMTTAPVVRDDTSRMDISNVTSEDQADTLAPRRQNEPFTTLSIVPSPPAKDVPTEPTDIESPGSTIGYFPQPLRTSKTPETLQPKAHDSLSPPRPQMLPALSSDPSMQGTESDRLRDEIVQSLTPKSTPYEGELERPSSDDDDDDNARLSQLPVADQPHPPGSTLDTGASPKTDDATPKNINAESNHSPSDASQMPTSPAVADKALPQPIASTEAATRAVNVGVLGDRLMLEQRFSWEPQPEVVASPSQSAASAPAVPVGGVQGSHSESDSFQTTRPYPQLQTPRHTDSPSVVPPMAPEDTLRRVQDEAPNNYDEASHSADAPPQGTPTKPSFRPLRSSLPASDANSVVPLAAREIHFREILSLGTPQDRIQAFNTTQEVIANQDTGLQEWLRAMGNQLPEHSDILRDNGRLSAQESENLASFKPSPARSKFQRFASLANASQPTSQSADLEYDSSSASIPPGGKSTNLHMPGQGKKLLKDASKIGGQAGVVAKGLFAKGKNKLRPSGGGGDKVAI
jgi:hypothetical protein